MKQLPWLKNENFAATTCKKRSANHVNQPDSNMKNFETFYPLFIGMIDAAVTHPLQTWKTQKQFSQRIIFSQLFHGIFANAILRGIAVSIQIATFKTSAKQLEQHALNANQKRSLAAFISALTSSLIISPAEHMITIQQKDKNKHFIKVCREFIHKDGLCNLYIRGFSFTFLRILINNQAIFMLPTLLQNQISLKHSTQQTQSLCYASISALTATCITHPLDTLKTRQQAGVALKFIKRKIYAACES